MVAVDRQEELGRWYLRLTGEEKDFVTVWLTVRQRTLHHETQVMPAPEVNVAETFEYLLRRNADLHQMRFALGSEDAVYLVGEVPVAMVTRGGARPDRGLVARLRRRVLPDGDGDRFRRPLPPPPRLSDAHRRGASRVSYVVALGRRRDENGATSHRDIARATSRRRLGPPRAVRRCG